MTGLLCSCQTSACAVIPAHIQPVLLSMYPVSPANITSRATCTAAKSLLQVHSTPSRNTFIIPYKSLRQEQWIRTASPQAHTVSSLSYLCKPAQCSSARPAVRSGVQAVCLGGRRWQPEAQCSQCTIGVSDLAKAASLAPCSIVADLVSPCEVQGVLRECWTNKNLLHAHAPSV